MMKQISIFTENKKGAMSKLLSILASHNINILGSVTNDSAEYGIVRMVVSQPEQAFELLTREGYLCRITEVLGAEIPDTPGSLEKLIDTITNMNVNVDYIYLSYNRDTGNPIVILHAESIAETKEGLSTKQEQAGFIRLI